MSRSPSSAAGWIRARLAQLDHATPPRHAGEGAGLDPAGLVPAAVLIAVTDRPEPGVLLTQRTASMRKHAGQIAFPGGRIDLGDRDAIAAALREAEEEIGLAPHHVSVIGPTDGYKTMSGFDITPVIGIVPPDLPLAPHVDEVDDIFEVPLAHLLDPANHATRIGDWLGYERSYYEIMWNDYRIWGITAAMLVNLSHRVGRL
jgi:8-oxo-dGTP pyrophosphatase MutT (NUDIX family)